MPEWGDASIRSRSGTSTAREEGEEGYDAGEQLRRALEQERHLRAARRRSSSERRSTASGGEEDGTVSLCKKGYSYWPNRPPTAATRWCILSKHPDWEAAERRLRRITSPPVVLRRTGPADAGATGSSPRNSATVPAAGPSRGAVATRHGWTLRSRAPK